MLTTANLSNELPTWSGTIDSMQKWNRYTKPEAQCGRCL